MKFSNIATTILAYQFLKADEVAGAREGDLQSTLSMIGNANLQHFPTFNEEVREKLAKLNRDRRRYLKKGKNSKKGNSPTEPCDPQDVELLDYPQWQEEKGYWIGEYTFLNGDATPYTSNSWNYPYDNYKGFITGEVAGNSYRQRNVFLYPPQNKDECAGKENPVVGEGECGVNGNTKVFEADQSATTCSDNEALGGDITGFNNDFRTTTELIGNDNALLYQVYFPGELFGEGEEERLYQSQFTTITKSSTGQVRRTRSAQGFDVFGDLGDRSVSYYRERRVEPEEFFAELEASIEEYNILESDLCTWDGNGVAVPGVTGSLLTCIEHLEESFLLGTERK